VTGYVLLKRRRILFARKRANFAPVRTKGEQKLFKGGSNMSSTSKTLTLQLNQWAAADPVLRADFNADNQKLEAAFAGLPYETLLDITTTSQAEQLNVDLRGIDLSKYLYVTVYLQAYSAATRAESGYARDLVGLRVNGLDTEVYNIQQTNENAVAGSYLATHYMLDDLPLITRIHLAQGEGAVLFRDEPVFDPGKTGAVQGYVAANQLQTLNLLCAAYLNGQLTYAFAPGTRVRVVGVRA